MKKFCLCAMILVGCASLQATMVKMTATFSSMPVDLNGSAVSYPFGGSFTFVYDDSLVPATGAFQFVDAVPTTLFLDHPTVGAITFDTTNTFLELYYTDGVLDQLWLGDRPSPTGTGSGSDDFAILLFDNGATSFAFYTLASNDNFFGFDSGFPASYSVSNSVSSAPETTPSLLLTGFCLPVLAVARRRRDASVH